MLYRTKSLNLQKFGVYDIKRAMLTADADDGLVYRVSLNNGKTWYVVKLNEPWYPSQFTSGRIIVEIKFPSITGEPGIYTLNASGVFPLSVGTTVYFYAGTNTFSTIVGPDGRYNIALPSGLYKVFYNQSGDRVVLAEGYNPEMYAYRQPDDLDKENTISMFLGHIDWATNAVFDTFKDGSKFADTSSAQIDLQQNLTDRSGRVVRYWALVFEA
jgi:hypothetical protein